MGNTEESPNDPDISLENIELEDIKAEKDPVVESAVPVPLLDCKSSYCGKKFASESALKYHVSFAHEKLFTKNNPTLNVEDSNKLPSLNLKVEPQIPTPKLPYCSEEDVSRLDADKQSLLNDDSNNSESQNPIK